MRLTVRLLLMQAAVILIAMPLSEQPQTATVSSQSDRASEPLCVGVIGPRKHDARTIAVGPRIYATPANASNLPLDSIFLIRTRTLSSGFSSAMKLSPNSAQLIDGLPEDNAPPPLRSLIGLAQIVDVSVGNSTNSFSPKTVTITAGDTIRWTWSAGPHSVTSGKCAGGLYTDDCSPDNAFCSPNDIGCTSGPTSNAGAVYSHQFNTPGTFPYYCSVHLVAMTGTVIVDAASGGSTLQFSASNYNVGEGDGHATINVTRTGDTSGAASVDYRTTDTDTFTVNCSDKHGNAFGRCDFATVVGTFTFAAGETTKTFLVPIIDDAYAEGNETFSVVLSNPTGATLGAPSTATVTINDNETSDQPNPILQTNAAGVSFFVRQHYLDFLGREPEQGEPWSPILNGCADQFNTNPMSPSANCDRINVSGSFFGSPEYKTKGFYVIDMYRVAFNRLPTYVEFSTDLASISGTTAQEVFAKRAAYASNFIQRTEFNGIYGAMTNTQFVNALMGGTQGQNYNLTSIRTANPANPDDATDGNKVVLATNDLINGLNGATLTKAQVLRAIVQSDEISLQKEAVNAFVASQYYGYLRRTPDQAGFTNWFNYLTNNPNDFRTMINGFLNSNEYRLRFGPV